MGIINANNYELHQLKLILGEKKPHLVVPAAKKEAVMQRWKYKKQNLTGSTGLCY